MKTQRERVMWAAGLFEGEGTVCAPFGGKLQISIGSTDQDVLETFGKIFGCGRIYGPYIHKNPNAKPQYRFTISGRRAYAVLIAMWPWLHNRRQDRATECIKIWMGLHQTGGRKPYPRTRLWDDPWEE